MLEKKTEIIDDIKIQVYEDWMKDEVIELFCLEYNKDKEELSKFFEDFYYHPYQRTQALLVAATAGQRVVGFQSYFYWPYRYKGKVYRSFESGNSLVHPDYRGSGVFGRLLKFVETKKEEFKINFFVGFPVQKSFGSFIRNKWMNATNLNYLVKVFNPLSFLFSFNYETFHKSLSSPFKEVTFPEDTEIIRKEFDQNYYEWQEVYRKSRRHIFYQFENENGTIRFELKLRKKGKIFSEIVIGDIRRSSADLDLLEKAIIELHSKIKQLKFVTISVLALNITMENDMASIFKKHGYHVTNKQVYFITKQVVSDLTVPIDDGTKWEVYRLDVDTW